MLALAFWLSLGAGQNAANDAKNRILPVHADKFLRRPCNRLAFSAGPSWVLFVDLQLPFEATRSGDFRACRVIR